MDATRRTRFSPYYEDLDETAKERYRQKLAVIGNIDDPYVWSAGEYDSVDWQHWPDVQYPDIYNYLISTPGVYTQQELKAYKSLEAYKYFVDGWVSKLTVLRLSSCPSSSLEMAHVRHSQSLSAAPVKAWVAVENVGTILCAHCTCMVGLGEACSHMAAILFVLDANSHFKESQSCTSLPCSWLPPSFKTVPYATIADIDFSTPKQKRRKLLEQSPRSIDDVICKRSDIQPSQDDLQCLYKKLSDCGKPAFLSIVPNFLEAYVPLSEQGVLPKPLTSLFSEHYLSLSYPDLLDQCEVCFQAISLSAEQAKAIEETTKDQAKSKIWFQQRAGRVTASKMKAAVHTDITQPAPSLIKGICHPWSYKFESSATAWGCDHEKTARDAYIVEVSSNHTEFSVSSSGLVIHTSYPYMAASPDGIIRCECCGLGVLEVKCPFSCINKTILEATGDPKFCLEDEDGKFTLKKTPHTITRFKHK